MVFLTSHFTRRWWRWQNQHVLAAHQNSLLNLKMRK